MKQTTYGLLLQTTEIKRERERERERETVLFSYDGSVSPECERPQDAGLKVM